MTLLLTYLIIKSIYMFLHLLMTLLISHIAVKCYLIKEMKGIELSLLL